MSKKSRTAANEIEDGKLCINLYNEGKNHCPAQQLNPSRIIRPVYPDIRPYRDMKNQDNRKKAVTEFKTAL